MKKIKIIDVNFSHAKTTCDIQKSKEIVWDRDVTQNDEMIIFTDDSMLSYNSFNGKKIGILMEPKSIKSNIYDWVSNNYDKFDKILTYDKNLLSISDKFVFYPHCGSWIYEEDQKIYNKTKLLSIISSEKRQTFGHNLRHKIIDLCEKNNIPIDVFGRGYNFIENKKIGLSDFSFSVVIENSKSDYYFTEKLIDSFITGTVPIYWGCPSIGDFFNINGMIIFNDEEDFIEKTKNINFTNYEKMLPYIKENFELSKKYLLMENWLSDNNIF